MITEEVIVVNMFEHNDSKNAKTSNAYISTSLRSILMIQHETLLVYQCPNGSSVSVMMEDDKRIGIA